jgi:hypothetical protein
LRDNKRSKMMGDAQCSHSMKCEYIKRYLYTKIRYLSR